MITVKIKFCHRSKQVVLVQLVLILSWLTHIQMTDAYFYVCSLMACGGIFCTCENYRHDLPFSRGTWVRVLLFSAVFSLSTILGNYSLFEPFKSLTNLFRMTLSFLGGLSLGSNVLAYLLRVFPGLEVVREKRNRPGRIFALSFGVIVLIDLAFLLLVEWPGVLTRDSMDQIRQIVTGNYSNLNPYWHTRTIGFFVKLGLLLTGDLHWGVALFNLFQILYLAGCFSYTVMTLYQKGAPRWCLWAVWAGYALIPYQIVYSVTVWKDILFSGASLLLTVSLYRLLCPVEKQEKRDWILFALGSMGLCLWRTNGLLVIAMLLIALTLAGRENRKLAAVLAAILVVGLVLCGPVLSAMGIQGSDLAETMSIPLQQIARACYDGEMLAQEDLELLCTIAEPEEFAEVYKSYLSDPVKSLLRQSPGYETLKESPLPYLKLWLRMGLRHPGSYLKAWVDQTRGYWNAGYSYWITAEGVFENGLGLVSRPGNIVGTVFYKLMRYAELMPLMHPLFSIGLYTWLTAVCCFVNRQRRRREWILSLPWLVIFVGLLIGTPVYAEFRYAYPVMLTCPLILTVTFLKTNE